MRKYIDIIRDQIWKSSQSNALQIKSDDNIYSSNIFMTERAMTQKSDDRDDKKKNIREWMIMVASQRHINEGKSAAEARQIVLKALGSIKGPKISFDDL